MKIPTTYVDKTGTVETYITNDGDRLVLDIDGTRFTGSAFDDFEIEDRTTVPSRFSLNSFHSLVDCQLITKIPIILLFNGKDFPATLHVSLEFYRSAPTAYGVNSTFSISVDGNTYTSTKIQDFESGLLAMQRQFPAAYTFKNCFGCAFSDYSVYGQGYFGSMLCFRNIKKEYLAVSSKDTYMDVMDNCDQIVQETYWCDQFEVRRTGTGYRG